MCINLLSWFRSYLANRKQRFIKEGFHSNWENTEAGVPQGSILGPYLFLIYINDIVKDINCNIRLFADDTSLFTVFENNDSIKLLEEDLLKITKFAEDWCIILNPTKTKSMKCSRKRNSLCPNVKFNNIELKDEPEHTHLGLTLSSDASLGEHIGGFRNSLCDVIFAHAHIAGRQYNGQHNGQAYGIYVNM